jgi:plasmid replication initiation protein
MQGDKGRDWLHKGRNWLRIKGEIGCIKGGQNKNYLNNLSRLIYCLHMKEKLTVYKSNQLITASYETMTMQEQLMLLACISSVDPRELRVDTAVKLTASAFADLADIDARGAYDDLKRAAERLFGRYLVIDNPDPENPRLEKTRTRWVHSIDYYPGEGTVCMYFSPKVVPYLSQLKGNFTKYKLKHVGNFSSSYGIRLYELLMQWQGKGSREVEIGWLREKWGLVDKYKSIRDVKKWVIEPAMKDINEHSNLWVKYGQRKRGREVVAFQFEFGLKEGKAEVKTLTKQQAGRLANPGETWPDLIVRLKKEGIRVNIDG